MRLRIYDASGRLVVILVDKEMPAARAHRVVWNGLDALDRPVASGVYFCRLDAPDGSHTRKLVVLR